MKGYVFALLSVFLVSAAQLLLHISVTTLPALNNFQTVFYFLIHSPINLFFLLLGVLFYGVSMYVWLFTLQYLRLGLAYPLLSLSYVLVWFISILLPGYGEVFNWRQLAGIMLILAGVIFIFLSAISDNTYKQP